jgi:phosphotransferase system enzyme I (PtsI)
MGFVTERGGQNSHGAILARALGIPAISGLPKLRDMVSCGMELLINGSSGEVVLWPRERTVVKIRDAEPEQIRMPVAVLPVEGLRVMSNISMPVEVKCAVNMQSEGIGLYRTEIELITSSNDYSEDIFYESYYNVFCENKGSSIAYRMFDIGSDKKLPGLNIPDERNPALGLRGARLLLKNRELLCMQARALARVSVHGPISVLYPMIIDKEQFIEIKQLFTDSITDIKCGEIKHGAMFEVPSACLQAEQIMDMADFGSIGTNDLAQYMFAADRDNELLVDDYTPDHPVLWKMLETVVAIGKSRKKTITVCGELAGDPRHTGRLIDSGVSAVSVSVRMIPAVRNAAKKYFEKKSE